MPLLIVALGYFIGSLPTAYIAGRILKGIDIRQVGDANMGAANAFRQLGAGAGITVGLVDAAKGALAVLIAQAAGIPLLAVLSAGAAAVIGHNWPVFIGFRGGRGMSTTIGVLLVVVTLPLLVTAGPAAMALLARKNVSLAAAFLFVPLPLVCWWQGVSGILAVYGMALPCLVGATHFLRRRRVASRV